MATIRNQRIRCNPITPGADMSYINQIGNFLLNDQEFREGVQAIAPTSLYLPEGQVAIGDNHNQATGTATLTIHGSQVNVTGFFSAGTGYFSFLNTDESELNNVTVIDTFTGTSTYVNSLTGVHVYSQFSSTNSLTGLNAYLHDLTVTGTFTGPVGNYITALTGDVSATGPGTASSIVNSIGGVTAYQVSSFTSNANIIRVNKDGSGNFTSINDALNSITTASSTNTYNIVVGPGVFTEYTISCKPYVWITGQANDCTVIQATGSYQHVIIGSDNSGISRITLTGATGTNFAGVYYQGTGSSFSTSIFYVYNCRYGDNYACAICDTTDGTSVLISQNCIVGAKHTFTYGWICRGPNPGRNEILECMSTGSIPGQPLEVFTCFGSQCEIIVQSDFMYALNLQSTGYCIHVWDGGTITLNGCECKNFNVGLYVENTGTGPRLDISGLTLTRCSLAIDIEHPVTVGSVFCSCNSSLVTVNPAAINVSLNLVDNGSTNDAIGQVVIGDIVQGSDYTKTVSISQLVRVTSTMGLIYGGVMTNAGGLTLDVTAGDGFLIDPSDLQVKEITWADSSLNLPANQTNHCYIDSNGILTSSTSEPILD